VGLDLVGLGLAMVAMVAMVARQQLPLDTMAAC
jgi:hypothetical protein